MAESKDESDELNEKPEIDPEKVDRSMLIKCFQTSDFEQADIFAKILLDKAKKEHGEESVNAWNAWMEYIEVQKRLKKDKIALELYLNLEELTIKLFGDDSENAASVFNNIAMLYYHTFQHGKTVPYFKKALAIWEKKYPANDQHIITTRNNIIVNSQLAVFDQQSAKHGVKIMKFDYTRDLKGRKPQNDEEKVDKNDKNDPKKMAAFTQAIDEKFGQNKITLPAKQQTKQQNENSQANND